MQEQYADKSDILKGSNFNNTLLSPAACEFCQALQEWLNKNFRESEIQELIEHNSIKWDPFAQDQEE
jgi:glutaredoxin